MNIFKKFLSSIGIPTTNRYNQAVYQYLNDGSVIWMPDKPQEYIDSGYYLNPDVYAAVQTIVNIASVAPLNLYRIRPDQKKSYQKYKALCAGVPDGENLKQRAYYRTKALEEVDGHKLLDKLNKPNEWQSGGELLANLYGFRLITGNAYLYKSRAQVGSPTVEKLYILPSQHMTIKSGGVMAPVGKYVYQAGMGKEEFEPNDVIHNRSWTLDYSYPGSHLFGISPLKAARRSITMSNDGREAQTAMLKNKGAKGLMAFDVAASGLKEQPTKEQLQDLKDEFNEKNGGVYSTGSFKNAGKVNLAVGKFEWHQMGMSSVDLSIIESQKWSKADIYQVYGISPILGASMEAATYSNYKEARKAAITMAVIPLLTSVRDTLNSGLTPEFDTKGEFVLDYDLTIYTELQADRSEQSTYLSNSIWLTLNEKRVEMGYGEIEDPNFNKIYVPSSLMTLDELNAPKDIENLPLNSGDYE